MESSAGRSSLELAFRRILLPVLVLVLVNALLIAFFFEPLSRTFLFANVASRSVGFGVLKFTEGIITIVSGGIAGSGFGRMAEIRRRLRQGQIARLERTWGERLAELKLAYRLVVIGALLILISVPLLF